MNEEKVKIKLNIAGESFLLSVPYSQQEEARAIEAEVNMLYSTWRSRFPEKSDRELLAMIAFRFADHYGALRREREAAREEVGTLSARLEEILSSDKG